jgi:tripartite-type tricarboxylate transporter receptor subunit TctC
MSDGFCNVLLRRLVIAAVCLASTTISAQQFPSRAVRIVVPFPAGGAVDFTARMIAQKIGEEWRQTVVVENQAGANGNVGADAVAKAAPDGHTLLVSSAGVFTTNRFLYKNIPYDVDRDLAPVSLAIVAPNVLVANPGFPVSDLPSLIARAKANPGQIHYASQGNGSTGHLTGALLAQSAGINIGHVPYRGDAPALNDVIAGHVPIMWATMTSVLPHIRGGRLKALVVGSRERAPELPDVPSAIEAGLADFQSVGWFAVAVTGGTPKDVIDKIAEAVGRAMRAPDVVGRLNEMGAKGVGNTPAEFAAFKDAETIRWKRVIEAANIRPE